MKARIEVVAIDSLMVRLFDRIDEANMPWMLAASQRLSAVFGEHLLDLVPSYTTLMVQFDLPPGEARALITQALEGLQPDTDRGGRRHEIPVWYDPSVGPELPVLAARSGMSEARLCACIAHVIILCSPWLRPRFRLYGPGRRTPGQSASEHPAQAGGGG